MVTVAFNVGAGIPVTILRKSRPTFPSHVHTRFYTLLRPGEVTQGLRGPAILPETQVLAQVPTFWLLQKPEKRRFTRHTYM